MQEALVFLNTYSVMMWMGRGAFLGIAALVFGDRLTMKLVQTDVLIIGAGAAGSMAAIWESDFDKNIIDWRQ